MVINRPIDISACIVECMTDQGPPSPEKDVAQSFPLQPHQSRSLPQVAVWPPVLHELQKFEEDCFWPPMQKQNRPSSWAKRGAL